MQVLLPLVLALMALAFILMPLWGGVTPLGRRAKTAALFSRDQLELDRELGKIDAQEYDELAPQIAATEAAQRESAQNKVSVEAIIAAFRRQKRVDTAVEVEVLVTRARRAK